MKNIIRPTILELPVGYTAGQKKGNKRKIATELLILSPSLKIPPDMKKFVVQKGNNKP